MYQYYTGYEGLVLTDCQETVCDPENNTANFVSIFEPQTVSLAISTSPKSTLHRGKGWGGEGDSNCQGMWLEIRHFRHLS